jgi:predicted transcriptional regulator
MKVQLPERQPVGLASLAQRAGRSASELAVEAVDRLLSQENWFDAQVQLGIDQIAGGEFLEEDEMAARQTKLNRSALVREALREHLRRLVVLASEERDRQGYAKRPQSPDESRLWEAEAAWPN